MPKTPTSPYAASFKSAVNRGTPCTVAVHNIASRTKKSPQVIFNSLCKAGLCCRQKFNGTWIYWPSLPGKVNATNTKVCQTNCWQWFVDWCICNGFCTPEQLNNCTSQQDFMKFCKKYFGKQFTATSGKSKPKTKRTTGRKYSSKNKAYSLKFPTAKSRTTGRRVRKAA